MGQTEFLTSPQGRTLAYRKTEGHGPGVVFLGGFKSDMEGSKALHLDDKIGSLEPGKYQDYNVFHLEPRDALVAERLSRVESADDALFALMFMMCECRDDVHVERHFDY